MPDRRSIAPATKLRRWALRTLCVVALASLCCGTHSGPDLPWHGTQRFRVSVEVDAAGHTRHDLATSFELDLRRIVGAAPHHDSLWIVEVDDSAVVIDRDVAFQFDPGEAGDADSLVLWLSGETEADASRRFLVYFDAVAGEPRAAATDPLVWVAETVDEEQESFRVETPLATWFYHRRGAGFSSLEDADGNDWIGFRPDGGSAGNFRGIPTSFLLNTKHEQVKRYTGLVTKRQLERDLQNVIGGAA